MEDRGYPTRPHRERSDPLPPDIAASIRRARLADGLGLRTVERRAKVSRSWLSELERGLRASPSRAVAEALIEALPFTHDEAAALLASSVWTGRSSGRALPDFVNRAETQNRARRFLARWYRRDYG